VTLQLERFPLFYTFPLLSSPLLYSPFHSRQRRGRLRYNAYCTADTIDIMGADRVLPYLLFGYCHIAFHFGKWHDTSSKIKRRAYKHSSSSASCLCCDGRERGMAGCFVFPFSGRHLWWAYTPFPQAWSVLAQCLFCAHSRMHMYSLLLSVIIPEAFAPCYCPNLRSSL